MFSIQERGSKRVPKIELMNASQIATYLLNSCNSLKNFDAFMFGSTLYGLGNDIDILIVGSDRTQLFTLKKELKEAANELPLDVLFMLPSEALETDFINKYGCISLYELSKKC